MTQTITSVGLLLILMYGWLSFKSFFTPTAVLCLTWIAFLMGQAILAPDMIFSFKASLLIFTLIFSFSMGDFIKILNPQQPYIRRMDRSKYDSIANDPSFKKRLEWLILILGVISIVGAVLYLFVFIRYFGSFWDLLTAGYAIRLEIGAGSIGVPLIIRMMFLLAYPAISMALVYWELYGFRWYLPFPFLTILIFGTVQAGRAGAIIVVLWVFISSFWKDLFAGKDKFDFSILKRYVFYPSLILSIFVLGLMYREQSFGNDIDWPSYLRLFNVYTFGAISAFSAFLDVHTSVSDMTWGLYSFSSLFELLGNNKLPFGYYDEYLLISNIFGDTTNVYTMFRPLIDDFGIIGAHIYMFIIGAFSSVIYSMTMRGSLPALSVIGVLYTLLIYSPIAPFTQHTSLIACFIIPPFLLRFAQCKNTILLYK